MMNFEIRLIIQKENEKKDWGLTSNSIRKVFLPLQDKEVRSSYILSSHTSLTRSLMELRWVRCCLTSKLGNFVEQVDLALPF